MKAEISSAVGPEAMNWRPARPRSSQETSDAGLPVTSGSVGAAYSGSIRASSAAKLLSEMRMKARNSTPSATEKKRSAATTSAIAREIRSGT